MILTKGDVDKKTTEKKKNIGSRAVFLDITRPCPGNIGINVNINTGEPLISLQLIRSDTSLFQRRTYTCIFLGLFFFLDAWAVNSTFRSLAFIFVASRH